MVVQRRRRRRRPVIPLMAVALTAAILLIALARGSSDKTLSTLAWLDEVRPIVEGSSQVGVDLADLRRQLPTLDRATVLRRVDSMRRKSDSATGQVQRIDAPGAVASAKSLLVATMVLRARALSELGPALDAISGNTPATDVAHRLADIGSQLVMADRNYAVFSSMLPDLRQPAVAPSQWLPDASAWDETELVLFVSSLRSGRSMEPIHDVAVITLTTDPPSVGKEGSAFVLPVAQALRMQVVVGDIGNESEHYVTVLATLTLPNGTSSTARQFVDLAPGQRQTVQLGGLVMARDQPMVLTVEIGPVTGETSIADNRIVRMLIVRG